MAKTATVYIRQDVKPDPPMHPRRSFEAYSADIGAVGVMAQDFNAFFPWSSIAYVEWRD